MPNLLKSAAKNIFHHAGGLDLARWLKRDGLRILMYHRFGDRAALARQCAHIRRHYQPISMATISEWLRDGRSFPPYAVAVTVDDGYQDFADAGNPVFAEYGIPVTVFLVTDFLDGKSWLWFDRVLYAFRHARVAQAVIPSPDGTRLQFSLDEGQRLADLMVGWSAAERGKLVAELPTLLKTELPAQAPLESRPMSWDTVRALAASGVEFGAHTKTHPILSAIADPDELRDEIAGSQTRIEAELDRPVLHFCYPNGLMRDIGAAAPEMVRAAGMRTAVTAEPGLNSPGQDAFLLRRVGTDPSHEVLYFERMVAGVALQ